MSTTPFYAGNEFADLIKHNGGLLHAVGASNYQVMRANRTKARRRTLRLNPPVAFVGTTSMKTR